MTEAILYERLGGYDGIAGFVNNLLPRAKADPQLARFWQHRAADSVAREGQLLIDYLCANAGGPMHYAGRDILRSHAGMGITESDWEVFMGHAGDTMAALNVPQQECDDVVAFVLSIKDQIIDS